MLVDWERWDYENKERDYEFILTDRHSVDKHGGIEMDVKDLTKEQKEELERLTVVMAEVLVWLGWITKKMVLIWIVVV